MGLISRPIAILDVENAEAFVQKCMDKTGIHFERPEREELLAEGLTILLELKEIYEPGIGGRDATTSTFAGFAAWTLPKRLGDAWHKSHPEHRYVTNPETGQRGWSYGPPMLSLDGLTDPIRGEPAAERVLLHARLINAFCHATQVASVCLSG